MVLRRNSSKAIRMICILMIAVLLLNSCLVLAGIGLGVFGISFLVSYIGSDSIVITPQFVSSSMQIEEDDVFLTTAYMSWDVGGTDKKEYDTKGTEAIKIKFPGVGWYTLKTSCYRDGVLIAEGEAEFYVEKSNLSEPMNISVNMTPKTLIIITPEFRSHRNDYLIPTHYTAEGYCGESFSFDDIDFNEKRFADVPGNEFNIKVSGYNYDELLGTGSLSFTVPESDGGAVNKTVVVEDIRPYLVHIIFKAGFKSPASDEADEYRLYYKNSEETKSFTTTDNLFEFDIMTGTWDVTIEAWKDGEKLGDFSFTKTYPNDGVPEHFEYIIVKDSRDFTSEIVLEKYDPDAEW